jgi:hypothetical protein
LPNRVTYKPAIPRRYLLLLAGFFWAIAGGILCTRAFVWLEEKGMQTMMIVEPASVVVAVTAYVLWFSKLVMRNIARIHALPEWACAFAFTAWHGYLMIGMMMTLGILLRNSTLPRLYLAVPYGVMGAILLVGSIRFFVEFAAPTPSLRRPEHER